MHIVCTFISYKYYTFTLEKLRKKYAILITYKMSTNTENVNFLVQPDVLRTTIICFWHPINYLRT